MPHLPSLPEQAHLADVLRRFPSTWEPLLHFHDQLLRAPGALSIGERERIAAVVSHLNGCRFCTNAHIVYAEMYGAPPGLIEALATDLEHAPVDEATRTLYRYVHCLTRTPAAPMGDLVAAMLQAGWSEEAVVETNLVVGLFCLMNRYLSGLGVPAHDQTYARRLEAIRRRPIADREAAGEKDLGSTPYLEFGKQAGVV
jgi:uncharacterized peroxidase-related enzyme